MQKNRIFIEDYFTFEIPVFSICFSILQPGVSCCVLLFLVMFPRSVFIILYINDLYT